MAGKRKKTIRNINSYFDRRKNVRQGGYPDDSICPGCGRAIVINRKKCRDCETYDRMREDSSREYFLSMP